MADDVGYMFDRHGVDRIKRGIRKIEAMKIPFTTFKAPLPQNNLWQFVNGAEETAPNFGVLQVSGGEFATNGVYGRLIGIKPTSSAAELYVINGSFSVDPGDAGCGFFESALTVLYSGTAPAFGERWGATPGQWFLTKNPHGNFISLGCVDEEWGQALFVQTTSPAIYLAEAVEAIAPDSSGLLKILQGSPGAETETGQSIIAFNHFGEVKQNAKVLVLKAGGNWHVAGGGGSPGVVAFELTAPLDPGGTAAAKLEDNTEITVKDWTESDPALRGDVGFRGWAVPANDPVNPELHLIVSMESYAPRIQCELYENMGQTTANQASVINPVGVGGRVPVLPPDVKLIVHDTQGLFKRALAGAKCEALYNAKEERYEVVECQTKAGWVIFRASDPPNVETGRFDALVVRFGGSQQDVQDPPRVDDQGRISISTDSVIGLDIKFQTYGYAILDAESDEYIAVKTYGSAEESGKIKVNDTDTLQYLEEKILGFNPNDIFNATTDLPIRFEVTNNNKLRAFIHGPDIAGWDDSRIQFLHQNGGTVGWVSGEECTEEET